MSGRSPQATTARSAGVIALFAALLAGSGCSKTSGGAARRGEPLRVAAASDLTRAFQAVAASFERERGERVELSFGSTGLLAKQIAEGAPFDVFAAADASFVDDVVRAGACLEDTRAPYARGRIVLWTKDARALPKTIVELAHARYKKIAIANPEHAPYGRAAREALTNAGVWSTVQPRTVYGENVQQALMFARSGNAEVAVVALSLALPSTEGAYLAIDSALHEPLDQEVVVCKGKAREDKLDRARAFAAFVRGEAGRAILRAHGLSMPDEPVTTGR